MSNDTNSRDCRPSAHQNHTRWKTYAAFVAAVLLTSAAPAAAQTLSDGVTSTSPTGTTATTPSLINMVTTACSIQEVETRLIEYDITPFGDLEPGSLTVDDRSSSRQSKLWFVTRNGSTRAYRLSPGRNIKKEAAQARSWELGAVQTGGVRLRHSDDGRFVFVNTNRANPATGELAGGALVAVDTREDNRITWRDRAAELHMSDVSTDTRGGGHSVFTAALQYQDDTGLITDGMNGVVQRLAPRQAEFRDGKWIVPAQVTRWLVGFGAGSCDDSGAGTCIPGIAVDRRRGHPIFVSEPDFPNGGRGAIGEVDPRPVKCPDDPYKTCVKVRHWPLPELTSGPRQILVDHRGRVWGITSSGHLFSLEVDRSSDKAVVTRHDPLGALEDLFAVAPDGGTIGFTDSNPNNNEVSVLFPNKVEMGVYPVTTFAVQVTRVLNGVREFANPENHEVTPRVADAMGIKYTNPGDGTYVETNVSTGTPAQEGSQAPSFSPTGMAPDGARRTGSFFYGVKFSAIIDENEETIVNESNRVGHFEVKIDPERELEYRKDDDDYDDDGDDDGYDPDDDDDGYNDEYDDDDDNDCILDPMDKDRDGDGVKNEYDSPSHRENQRTERGSMAPGQSKAYEMEADSSTVLMLAVIEASDLTTPLSIEIVDPAGNVIVRTPPALGKAVATATPALPGVYTVRARNSGTSTATVKSTLIGRQIWF